MNGTEILMKQLLKMAGIGPEQFDQMASVAQNVGAMLIEIRDRQTRVEAKLDRLLALAGTMPVIDLQPERTNENGPDA